MSYCRFGADSDVYVVGTGDGYQCLHCPSEKGDYASWHGETRAELLDHLLAHMADGHKVPFGAMDRLVTEITGRSTATLRIEMLSYLLHKFSLPTEVFNHYVRTARMIHELETQLGSALDNLADLNWPEEDELDD